MGFLGLMMWLSTLGAFLTVAAVVAVALVGDRLLTGALRRFASAYVGAKVDIRWDLRQGLVALEGLVLGRPALALLEPYLGLPMDLERLALGGFVLVVPWVERLYGLVRGQAAADKPMALESRIEIAGFEVALGVHDPERWMWMAEGNIARSQAAIDEAARARQARVEAWTATVTQKLQELADRRRAQRSPSPATPPPKPTAIPAWHKLVDELIDSFAIVVRQVAITIRDDTTDTGIGLALERFELGRGVAVGQKRKRLVQVNDFQLFVNPTARATSPRSVIAPVSLELGIVLPCVFQSLVQQELDEQRIIEVDIAFPTNLVLQLRPVQLARLMALLRPLSFHADWLQRAAVADEARCIELQGEEREEYLQLFRDEWTFQNETGFVPRLIAGYRHKAVLQSRKERIEVLQATMLASRLLALRSVALGWDIPPGGTPLPFATDEMRRRKDLRVFITNSLDKYAPPIPAPAMIHSITLALRVPSAAVELLEDAGKPLMTVFSKDMDLKVRYAMTKVDETEHAIEVDFKIPRFGLLDERDAPSNVFRRLLDRNPQATTMFDVQLVQNGNGHIDLRLVMADFSLLVIFDPLLQTAKSFLPALEEDEATQMKYLAQSMLTPPRSPEVKDESVPVYKDDVPEEYSPLMLSGMSLFTQIEMSGCEICLLGDSASLKSHVLAFTSDTKLSVVSSSRHEAIELELVDVALQPCTVLVTNDGLDLELAGLRTILELEGEGVDLQFGYRIVVGESKSPPSSRTSAISQSISDRKRSGANLWKIARTAVAKKQIAEVEHEELRKAEEEDYSHVAGKPERVKAAAKRKIVLNISDFALNLSPNDLGVFLSIFGSLNAAMWEDYAVVKQRELRDARIANARKELEEKQYMERLKAEFKLRDIDGGGSLDATEIEGLISNVASCQNLTKEELDATVRDFIDVVDRDGSGDISLEEFESVLSRQKVIYHRLHHGVVSLTGNEYVDPLRPRSTVPTLISSSGGSLAESAALASFWDRYEQQVGAPRTTLNGVPPIVVQKKMVRAFKNYEYAQEAWIRLVNPSLAKPAEQSVWLLTKEMDMGSRGDVIDQLLSSFDHDAESTQSPPARTALQMFIHTIISTSFGGFYLRLIDETLPMGVPSLEVCFEEVAIFANFSVWEGDTPDSNAEVRIRKRVRNNFGIAKVSFAMYGKYYNTKSRQVEPFIEYFPGTLDVRKDPDSHLDIVFTSDQYFQLNLTFGFMEVVKANLASFMKAEKLSEKERPHIKEEGGLFWMLNETGVNMKYYVVVKKQTKDQFRVETVTPISNVPSGAAHPCTLLSVDEELKEYEQQSLKEKQLRQAFRNADSDNSGELDASEVRAVLREVYEEQYKYRKRTSSRDSSMLRRSDSILTNDAELDALVEDFIALADTDGSGQVSWEEFKIAISKSRETVDRFVSLEIEGYKPIHDIPISFIGHTQVFELTPYFEDVEAEKSVEVLYEQAVHLLNGSDRPSRADLAKAFACLKRIKESDPSDDWVDSYYVECIRAYLPTLVAVQISVDGLLGLQVKVAGGANIRNDTAKPTECILIDDNGEPTTHNPVRLIDGKRQERFMVLPPNETVSIPLNLVDVGQFAIRQIGETEWSNYLPLTVHPQRLFKNLTRFEQAKAKRALHDRSSSSSKSIAAAQMVAEKLGKDVALPDLSEFGQPGKEIVYPSTSIIDNQPTIVVEKVSANDAHLGTWSIVIQPQLILHNVLPCGIEYAIVQAQDCPSDTLDGSGKFPVTTGSESSKSSKPVKLLGHTDYFQFVNEVNCRRMFVESGKTVQVFGLDLDAPALMKIRLCVSESNRAGVWSPTFQVRLDAGRESFNSESFELVFDNGPCLMLQQQWPATSARSLIFNAPYWIQNRSGLDFRFRLHSGTICSVEQHRTFFNGSKEVPMLANGPPSKAMLSVRPYQETARSYCPELFTSPNTKRYLPNFNKADWSENHDMSNVGTKGELRSASNYTFVVAYEVLAAPGQFFRSKIFRITPRFVFVNRVPRPLQLTPVMLDKKLRGIRPERDLASNNASMKVGDVLVVYRFVGTEKHQCGMRLRDIYRDEALTTPGEWSPNLPITPGEDFNIWTRGSLGDGPACNIAFQNSEETIYVIVSDISTTPRYRIENRSTRYSFRYVQVGTKHSEEILIKPLQCHSFVWDNPIKQERLLKVTPLNWKIPTMIDFNHVGPCPALMSNGLYSEIYIDGSTRVFAVGDTPVYSAQRQQVALNDWLSNILIDFALHGFGLTIVDGHPQELLNLTMENVRFSSPADSRKCVFSLHHFQMDDMSPNSLYPVVFAPLDSGFNSDKREGWIPRDGERPFLTVTIETDPQAGILIVDDFSVELQSIALKINLEYVLGVVNVLMEFIPGNDEATVAQQGVDYKNVLLAIDMAVPEYAGRGGALMYIKKWWMSSYDFHLVFDSSSEDHGEGISSILGSTVGSIVGGIAHVTPEFHFGQILYLNRFFFTYDLMYAVVLDIVYTVVRQWYRIVGSVELLGDPVGLATDIVDGFALAGRQLKRDIKGKSLRKGEGALTLVQTVLGAPMKSIGKVSNGLGDVLKKATDFESQEEVDQPRHVPDGLLQSGVVLTKSLAYGVKGFVKEPVRGAKREGVKGFAKGVGRGTLQLVASPLVGTLGVFEKLSHSVNNTTHLLDEKTFEGTRRPARDLVVNPLKQLTESNVITEVEVHVLCIEGLPESASPQVVVRVFQQAKGGPARDLAKFKSSTLHHTGTPKFDQSWLIPIASHDTFIEVNVYHKRKPIPKKLLGYRRFSLEDIYRDFEGVPAKILADTKAKVRLKKRKRFSGSILNELATTSSQGLEVRDDTWRQRMSKTSMANFLSDEFDDENDENDDYDQDVALLSSRSIMLDQPYEVRPVGLPLLDCESNAKIFLSIRYVNDMRR